MGESAPGQKGKFYLAWNPDFDPEEPAVKFRLTYEGRLESDGTAEHKHEIRKALHPQLKRLWAIQPNLKDWRAGAYTTDPLKRDALADAYSRNGYRFVPLATADLSLIAALDILFLRPDVPGGLLKSGDIDNRLKTLFDGLRMPTNAGEFGKHTKPEDGEDPFYVLMEQDSLISHVSVETDTLLEPTPSAKGQFLANDARLIITVTLKPYHLKWENLSLS